MKTNNLTKVIILVGLILIGMQINAQNAYAIKGKIVKSDRNSVGSASVTLLDTNTQKIVSETSCNKGGKFMLENIKPGKYLLSVHKTGFKKPCTSVVVITEDGSQMNDTTLAEHQTIRKNGEEDIL